MVPSSAARSRTRNSAANTARIDLLWVPGLWALWASVLAPSSAVTRVSVGCSIRILPYVRPASQAVNRIRGIRVAARIWVGGGQRFALFSAAAAPTWRQTTGRTFGMPECFVAKATDLKDGDRRIVVSGKHEVGVFFMDGAYYAYSNYCVHA